MGSVFAGAGCLAAADAAAKNVPAVDRRDPSLLTSSLEASVESHLIGFACEESRRMGKKVRLHG